MKTLTITNFGGPLTRRSDGDIDSGLAKYDTSWGYDPFSKPGNLTWFEQPTSILNLGYSSVFSVMKPRVEGDTGYVYCVNASKDLYKIQVNNTSSPNANYDNPSIVGALTDNTNVTRGAGMVFFGATEKIFYGDDSTIQKINFDGSGASVLALTSSVVTAVPRAMVNFLGKIYFTNGNNIGEIDSTELITTGAKLSPGLPAGVIGRDLDVTPDGNYLQITATKSNPNGGFTDCVATPATSTDSYKFLWNGIDDAATYFEEYGGLGLTSSQTFGDKNYALGYDPQGAAIYSQQQKIISLPKSTSPHPTATFTIGNNLGFMTTEFADSKFKGSLYQYGQYDNENTLGLYRLLRQDPAVKTDIISVNACTNVSNLMYFPSGSIYENDIASSGKVYFSTVESNSIAANKCLLWKFTTVPTGVGSVVAGVYETQNQLFSKKVRVGEVRLYTEPLVADNSFSIGLVNSASSVIASNTYTVGSNVTAGEDLVKWNPAIAPTYALGVRITNLGSKNWTGTKLELDINEAK